MDTPYGNGIDSDLEEALAENAIAKARFNAMPDGERKEFLRRAREIRGLEEQKKLLNELVGWKKGHEPYQL